MNKKILLITTMIVIITTFIFDALAHKVNSHSAGAGFGYADDPIYGFTTCATPGCHNGPAVSTVAGMITTNIPVAGYKPDTTYTITATVTRAGHVRFGFEITAENPGSHYLGTIVNTNSNTALTPGNSHYITHTSAGTVGTVGSHTWTFHWVAPVAGSGPVTFYGCFNASNDDGTSNGDTILASTTVVPENTSAGIDELNVNKIGCSVYPNPCKDVITISIPTDNFNTHFSVYFYTISGKEIAVPFTITNSGISETNLILNTLSLPTGIYFCRVNDSERSIFSGKIVVAQ
jgi:type IX secretion system substrate protein